RQASQGALNDFAQNRTSVPDTLEQFLELAGSVYSLYQEASLEQKRRMLKIVASNLGVHAKTIDFSYQIPFNLIAEREKTTSGRPAKGVARIWDPLLTQLLAHFEKEPLPDLSPVL